MDRQLVARLGLIQRFQHYFRGLVRAKKNVFHGSQGANTAFPAAIFARTVIAMLCLVGGND